jgi:hypothetical protein
MQCVLGFSEKQCLKTEMPDLTLKNLSPSLSNPIVINEGAFWEYECTPGSNTWLNYGPGKLTGYFTVQCPSDLTNYMVNATVECVPQMQCEVLPEQEPNTAEGIIWFDSVSPGQNSLHDSETWIT